MPYTLEDKLVVGIASSALFDLSESDKVFREQGVAEYRAYQREHENDLLPPGVAMPFVRRLLGLNPPGGPDVVQVVLISKNDADCGLRVSKSIKLHGLSIIRMAFLKGGSPHRYLRPYKVSLFLSANPVDIKECVVNGHPAGQVLPSTYADDPQDKQLRIAFDFDGVIVDDEAERAYSHGGIEEFRQHEAEHALEPHADGPLAALIRKISEIQKQELQKQELDKNYEPRIRIAIITSRDAVALERMVTTLRKWGLSVDETHLLGGVDKCDVLQAFAPHIFFDDQRLHLDGLLKITPSVHIPFGVRNESAQLAPDLIET